VTARWVVDVVQPERDLKVTWQPISLLFKNQPPEDSDYHAPVDHTHKLLRVFESVNAAEGNDAAFEFYWLLENAGLDTSHATAFDDESFDAVIREKMDAGLALVGNDVGTPIISFPSDRGKIGIFGPVISRAPQGEEGLALWDAMITMSTMDGFWELKRTRTEGPEFGERP